MTSTMYRKCLGHVISGLRRKCISPYILLLPMVLFILYTLLAVLNSGSSYLRANSVYAGHKSSFPREKISSASKDGVLTESDSAIRLDFEEARKYVNIYKMSDDYKADFRCVEMKITPRTPVCVYDSWSDMYISHDLIETGIWEKHVLIDFLEDLKRDESLGVLDIGANIGVYSLLAANLGRKVIAVEPYKNNIIRLHRSAVLAGTTKNIVVLENAVSDIRGVATLRTNGNNQGDTRIVMGYEPCMGSCPSKINTILISDLRYVMTFDRAIMKIDIQGYEHLAFSNIELLLKSVSIPYIYMEWLIMKTHGNSTIGDQNTELVKNMVKTLYNLHYRPYTLTREGGTELLPGSWHTWPLDIVWRHLPSEKEYTKLMKNHFMIWPSV